MPTDATDVQARLEEAARVAREAGALARRYFDDPSSLEIGEKGVQDWVTQADREVERSIRGRLTAAFEADGFVGEEGGRQAPSPATGGGTWVVDPIDGTANFMRGVPWFAVSIAWIGDTEPELGVVYDVVRDQLYAARSGGGATCNGTSLSASVQDRLDRSALCLGFWTRGGADRFVEVTQRAVAARCDVRRLGSAALALAYVARGAIEGFWQTRIHPWDVAAGVVLVREAGGFVSPFFARNGLNEPQPILAAARPLASALTELVDLPAEHRGP
jgi:myo-inositol-1(or 4)-monophosphatase